MEREDILSVYEAGPEAVIALVNNLCTIIEQQAAKITELEERIKSLEERLNKNSHNSSKPPSTDTYSTTKPIVKSRRKKSRKKAGGQNGHPGTTLKMVDNPDETILHKVDQCRNCCTSLEEEVAIDYEIKQGFGLKVDN